MPKRAWSPAISADGTQWREHAEVVEITHLVDHEGYRKVRARLRREYAVKVGGKRVLRLMRREGLLAPQRFTGRRSKRPHDSTIIPDGPNLRWGTDATMAWTRDDGWVWVFVNVDHFTAEAWTYVSKVGDRIAALDSVYQAVVDRYGRLDADVARGIELRHDWGPHYRSHHYIPEPLDPRRSGTGEGGKLGRGV